MKSGGQARGILCFGEILLRLSATGRGHLFQAPTLAAHFGGAEANVAVALARLGRASAVAGVVPDDAVGDAAVEAVRRHGVDVSRVMRASGRLGLYYLTPGAGQRASAIVYDRAGSVFAQGHAMPRDWPALLDGMEWLHLSGITPALGPDLARTALTAAQAARAAGVKLSFDGNYRASLWERWCPRPRDILEPLVACADLLFGNHRDIALLLDRPFSGDGPERRREAALAMFDRFPDLRHIASTARHVVDADHHRLSARVDTRDGHSETDEVDVTGIVDRIGTGDAFAAGVLAGLDAGIEEAAELGLALAVLKHAMPGDFSLTGPRELAVFREGGLDVRR